MTANSNFSLNANRHNWYNMCLNVSSKHLISLIETISFSVNDTYPLSTFFMDGHIWKVEFTIYQVSLKGLDNDVTQIIKLIYPHLLQSIR